MRDLQVYVYIVPSFLSFFRLLLDAKNMQLVLDSSGGHVAMNMACRVDLLMSAGWVPLVPGASPSGTSQGITGTRG